MKVNLNDQVRVKLTPKGLKLLEEERNKIRALIPPDIDANFSAYIADENGLYYAPLWKIMNIFGRGMSPGIDTPFEACEIFLCERVPPRE